MAEWPFTDFFKLDVPAARNRSRRTDTSFHNGKAALANRPDEIENPAQRQ
jgi:hypothetical protein